MAACETLLIRDGDLIIRDGGLLLCEEEVVPDVEVVDPSIGAAVGLPDFSGKRKRDVDVAVAMLMLLANE